MICHLNFRLEIGAPLNLLFRTWDLLSAAEAHEVLPESVDLKGKGSLAGQSEACGTPVLLGRPSTAVKVV